MMSKELEALKQINEQYNMLLDRLNESGGLGNLYLRIKQSLTPPTEQEVCEALSEHFQNPVSFRHNDFWVDYKDPYSTAEYIDMDMLRDKPHLITMIGRFFEKESERE